MREVQEEAGLDVELKGLLRVEYSLQGAAAARLRVVYYAEPRFPDQPLKVRAAFPPPHTARCAPCPSPILHQPPLRWNT